MQRLLTSMDTLVRIHADPDKFTPIESWGQDFFTEEIQFFVTFLG